MAWKRKFLGLFSCLDNAKDNTFAILQGIFGQMQLYKGGVKHSARMALGGVPMEKGARKQGKTGNDVYKKTLLQTKNLSFSLI